MIIYGPGKYSSIVSSVPYIQRQGETVKLINIRLGGQSGGTNSKSFALPTLT